MMEGKNNNNLVREHQHGKFRLGNAKALFLTVPHFSNICYGGRRGSHGEWPDIFSRSNLTNGRVMEVGMNKDTD